MHATLRKGGGIVSLRVLVGIVLLLALLVVGGVILNYGGDTAKTVMDEILGLRDVVPDTGSVDDTDNGNGDGTGDETGDDTTTGDGETDSNGDDTGDTTGEDSGG